MSKQTLHSKLAALRVALSSGSLVLGGAAVPEADDLSAVGVGYVRCWMRLEEEEAACCSDTGWAWR